MLLSNGISFAIQIVVFLFLGSFAGELRNSFRFSSPDQNRFRNMAAEHLDLFVAGGMGYRFWLAGGAHSVEMGNSNRIVYRWPCEFLIDFLHGVQTDKYQSLHTRQP